MLNNQSSPRLFLIIHPNYRNGCPMLEWLTVAWIENITDNGVTALCRGCQRLQFLNLKGCRHVSKQTSDLLRGGGERSFIMSRVPTVGIPEAERVSTCKQTNIIRVIRGGGGGGVIISRVPTVGNRKFLGIFLFVFVSKMNGFSFVSVDRRSSARNCRQLPRPTGVKSV